MGKNNRAARAARTLVQFCDVAHLLKFNIKTSRQFENSCTLYGHVLTILDSNSACRKATQVGEFTFPSFIP